MIRQLAWQVLARLGRSVFRTTRRDEGSATIEFVIIFPIFMALFLSVFEAGMLTTRYVMLERGLDLSVRVLRLNTGMEVDHSQMRDAICEAALILPNCQALLKVELAEVSTTTWQLSTSNADCIERGSTEEIEYDFETGNSDALMFVRACLIVDPWFPLTGLGLRMARSNPNGYRMVAVSAFVHEPVPGDSSGI